MTNRKEEEIREELEKEFEEDMTNFKGRCIYVMLKHGISLAEIAKEFRTDEEELEKALKVYLTF